MASNTDSTTGLGERPSEWLRAAREGDRNALEQLVEDRRAELLSMAVSQLDSDLRVKEAPSDIVQQSLLEGVQSFGTFRGRSIAEFGRFLKSILNNNLRDLRRRYIGSGKRSLAREVSGIDVDGHADGTAQTPSGWYQSVDEAQLLRSQFEALPDEQRRLLQLRYWDQLTFDEIASVLGEKPDATRKAFYRALTALAENLEPHGR